MVVGGGVLLDCIWREILYVGRGTKRRDGGGSVVLCLAWMDGGKKSASSVFFLPR